jgi:outer membrane immunogenic protein
MCTPFACDTKNNWISTLRGRVGYAVDRVLFYGTAGGAFGNIKANTNTTAPSVNKAGWTAGAGVEAAFADNWTARIEYLYVDLENASSFTTLPGPTTVKFNTSMIRLGVDYKFR